MSVPEGYFAVLYREGKSGTIGVRFPEHPGVTTYGQDYEDAPEMPAKLYPRL